MPDLMGAESQASDGSILLWLTLGRKEKTKVLAAKQAEFPTPHGETGLRVFGAS